MDIVSFCSLSSCYSTFCRLTSISFSFTSSNVHWHLCFPFPRFTISHLLGSSQPWASFYGSAILDTRFFFSLSSLKLLEARVSRLDKVHLLSTGRVMGTSRVKSALKIRVLELDFLCRIPQALKWPFIELHSMNCHRMSFFWGGTISSNWLG